MRKLIGLALAVLIPTLTSPALAVNACDIPLNFTNQVTIVESDMWIGFATDKHDYSFSDTVQFYLVVKNIGTELFYINWGIDPQDGLFVLPLGCTSVQQVGCFDHAAFYYPGILYYYSAGTTLNPGECRIWTEMWDIDRSQTPESGTYTILGGMFEATPATEELGQFVVPVGGAQLTVTIGGVATGVRDETHSTWGMIKALYENQ
jgi:hypothetical protein